MPSSPEGFISLVYTLGECLKEALAKDRKGGEEEGGTGAKPIPAEKAGESRKFEFEIEIEAEGYENSFHYFDVPIISDSATKTELNTACSIKIRDAVLFKREVFEEAAEKESTEKTTSEKKQKKPKEKKTKASKKK